MRRAFLSLCGLFCSLLLSTEAFSAGFEPGPCSFETDGKKRIECGYLSVPELRSDPDSRLLRLPVVIFRGDGSAGRKNSEPLLMLNGGPGGSNWVSNESFLALWAPFVKALQVPGGRDVILFSQRGTDNKEASAVDCPVFDQPEYYLGASRRPGRQSDWRSNVARGLMECRRALSKAGYPISAYSSLANVEDVIELRAALGLEKLAIYGVSYGARLAVELVRHNPQGLTRIVLDSPSPPESDVTFRQVENLLGAIRRLEEDCERYRACRPYKSIESNLRRLIKSLDKAPREVRIRSQVTNGRAQALYLKFDSAVLVDVLFFSFYFPDRILVVPKALNDAIAGNFDLLVRLAGQSYFYDTGINYVTNTSVFCQDVPADRPITAIRNEMKAYPDFRLFLENGLWLHENLCPIWIPNAEVHVHTNPEPVLIPTLILSGGLDPVTPLLAAEALLPSLPEAQIVFDPKVTHGTLPQSDCVRRKVRAFLKGKEVSARSC